MTVPGVQLYEVRTVNGDTYDWIGHLSEVFANITNYGTAFLKCEDGSSVNSNHVVALKPKHRQRWRCRECGFRVDDFREGRPENQERVLAHQLSTCHEGVVEEVQDES